MILPFSRQLNGKPTYFVEKILRGLIANNLISTQDFSYYMSPMPLVRYPKAYGFIFDRTIDHKPKIHTIREDKNNRWKRGVLIDFFINCRQPNMFRFAPTIAVLSVQDFEITWSRVNNSEGYAIKIDKKYLDANQIYELAHNDGFDTVDDFFEYFNENFQGKIIHWTDKRY